jgi:hypothetical protein
MRGVEGGVEGSTGVVRVGGDEDEDEDSNDLTLGKLNDANPLATRSTLLKTLLIPCVCNVCPRAGMYHCHT